MFETLGILGEISTKTDFARLTKFDDFKHGQDSMAITVMLKSPPHTGISAHTSG
jgi:hypothetical protein